MPWSQTMPRDQRVQFIADYLRQTLLGPALPPARPHWPGGTLTQTSGVAPSDPRGGGGGDPGGSPPPSQLGSKETPQDPHEETSAQAVAPSRHRLRDSEPSRLSSQEAAPAHRPSQQAHPSDPG